ncbi:dihydrofolate reductase [Enterococcus sp. JM4C]|uniref:dihydrofolate reductase family protein n=1 Tax=Candidatus Enterococcus huntleyi TaxID=1857217 RepID=UPI001379A8EF|nr:dihydrofolate reductase family protein [Enterococcus sp. JM4C]KAF1297566.1 dihydrofolate reductase [Enterococcus sp. JM4C]
MRKIVFYGGVSLDGYLADESRSLQWLFDADNGTPMNYEAFIDTIDTTIMGRKTFEEALMYSEGENLYPDQTNYVFSRSSQEDKEGFTFISEDLVQFVKKLRAEEGKDIWIIGGGNLLKPLLEEDMIDEWWIQFTPVLLGKGIRLFEEGTYRNQLELLEVEKLGNFAELHLRKKQAE